MLLKRMTLTALLPVFVMTLILAFSDMTTTTLILVSFAGALTALMAAWWAQQGLTQQLALAKTHLEPNIAGTAEPTK